ncbi:MAG: hypothetical protein JKP98_07265 [Rhodobacteraceae bacterium]|nr:hypothetical protein [Paracoccaceae bacterium]
MPLHKAALIAGALALMATMAGAVETRVMVAGDDSLTGTLRDSSRAIGALEGGNEDGTDRSAPLTPTMSSPWLRPTTAGCWQRFTMRAISRR